MKAPTSTTKAKAPNAIPIIAPSPKALADLLLVPLEEVGPIVGPTVGEVVLTDLVGIEDGDGFGLGAPVGTIVGT